MISMFSLLTAGKKRRNTPKRRSKNIRIRVGKGYRSIPQRYVPKNLSRRDASKQKRSIRLGKKRPKVKYPKKKSGWTKKFHDKYGDKSLRWISKYIISKRGINEIKRKGIAAYYTSGSRPNQTPQSWWKARLYSVIMGGPARRIDKKIWNMYKITK